MKLFFYAFCLVLSVNISFSQSKKEQITKLQSSIDSLNTVNSDLLFKKEKMINNETQLNKVIVVKKDSISMLKSKIKTLENEKKDYQNQLFSLQNKTGYSKWFLDNFNIKIYNSFFEASKININNFPINIPEDIKETLKTVYFLGDWQNEDSIEIRDNAIVLNIENINELRKTLIITNNRIIISYHVSMGSEGGAYIFDLQSNKGKGENMYVTDVQNENQLIVEKDYYDNKGHVFETGIYNINTGKYTLTSKEH